MSEPPAADCWNPALDEGRHRHRDPVAMGFSHAAGQDVAQPTQSAPPGRLVLAAEHQPALPGDVDLAAQLRVTGQHPGQRGVGALDQPCGSQVAQPAGTLALVLQEHLHCRRSRRSGQR